TTMRRSRFCATVTARNDPSRRKVRPDPVRAPGKVIGPSAPDASARKSAGRSRLVIDIAVASPLWTAQRSAKAWLRRALAQAAGMVSTSPGELAIVLTDDSAIRALNRAWRGKDEATNVLSFPTSAKVRRGQHGTR